MILNNQNENPLAGSAESIAMDRIAQREYGLSAEVLMESAGALSAGALLSDSLCSSKIKKNISVLVFCGPGNNGGDGLVMARHLLSEGWDVKVFLPADKLQTNPNSKAFSLYEKQKLRLLKQGAMFKALNDKKAIKKAIVKADVMVDALFGVGLSREVQEPYASLMSEINKSDKRVVSLDTPSGLNVDTGHVWGQGVKADLTLSFGLAKPGFYLMDGPSYVGQLKVFSIGFPSSARLKKKRHFLIKKSWVSVRLPRRAPADHKAKHGHLLVLAGREGFWGAGVLTATAGYRMGAGYVTLSPGTHSAPDILTQNVDDPHLLKNKTAVAIGPGSEVGEQTSQWLKNLKKIDMPVVVDASAWVVCVQDKLFPVPSHWILTPHSGELGQMFGITGSQVDQDRCFYAMKASAKSGALILLKGFHSVLAWKNKCWIIPTGNSALSKAGTGDVLTGFIGALLARGLSAFSAGAVGSFLHGLLAEEWVRSGKDRECLMAQDLKDILPVVLQKEFSSS